MKRFCVAAALALAMTASAADKGGEWVKMFDGKTLDGWKATEKPEQWAVKDGAITSHGERSHLMWMKEECENCEFKATVKINKGGNSGMFFRSEFMTGWPNGYEAQVNTSHKDPVKTGSLYNIVKIFDQLVPDDTWFTQHIIADGNRIIIKVNDKVVVDHADEKRTHMKGYLGLQQHDPGSFPMYKDILYRKLPSKK
jgi:Domain of Unknown Function (DUF1080)